MRFFSAPKINGKRLETLDSRGAIVISPYVSGVQSQTTGGISVSGSWLGNRMWTSGIGGWKEWQISLPANSSPDMGWICTMILLGTTTTSRVGLFLNGVLQTDQDTYRTNEATEWIQANVLLSEDGENPLRTSKDRVFTIRMEELGLGAGPSMRSVYANHIEFREFFLSQELLDALWPNPMWPN